MSHKKNLSIRGLVITSFIVPVLLLILSGGIALHYVLQESKQTAHISSVNELVEKSRQLDELLIQLLFDGLTIIHSPVSPPPELLNDFRSSMAQSQQHMRELLSGTHELLGSELSKIHGLELSLSLLQKVCDRLLDGERIETEQLLAVIHSTEDSNENLRLLLMTPQNLRGFVTYQQLITRRTVEQLASLTFSEAAILYEVVHNKTIDDNAARRLILIRNQAERKRAILNVLYKYMLARNPSAVSKDSLSLDSTIRTTECA